MERAIRIGRMRFVRPLVRLFPAWVTPNHLSLLRLLCTGVLAALLWNGALRAAAGVYLLAVLTDAFDGELARLRGQITKFGTRFDPTVDKLLHAVIFVFFWRQEPLLFSLLLAADGFLFMLGAARALMPHADPTQLQVSVFGRWKMILQSLGSLVLFGNAITPALALRIGGESLLSIALLCAVLSGAVYLRRLRV